MSTGDRDCDHREDSDDEAVNQNQDADQPGGDGYFECRGEVSPGRVKRLEGYQEDIDTEGLVTMMSDIVPFF